MDANKIELVLPNFRYRAIDPTGIVENEVCPVYVARITGVLNPNPAEVADWAWISPALLADALEHTPSAFSPWLGLQFPQLLEANALPLQAGAEA
ncbi:Isopentenyl-diphosphate Delta-isomerase [compost metagenome]